MRSARSPGNRSRTSSFAEAELVDEWKLAEWLALFDEEQGCFFILTTDVLDFDPNTSLYLIADDMTRLPHPCRTAAQRPDLGRESKSRHQSGTW